MIVFGSKDVGLSIHAINACILILYSSMIDGCIRANVVEAVHKFNRYLRVVLLILCLIVRWLRWGCGCG